MIESLLVLAAVALLAGVGLVAPLLPAALIVQAGAALAAAGALFGLPTGFWYHVRLRAVLLRRGALPGRWWIRPVALHGRIPDEERASVLLWFYLGGLGFVAIVLGCIAIAGGVLLEVHRSGAL